MIAWRVWWRMEEKSWSSELEQAKQHNLFGHPLPIHSGRENVRMSSVAIAGSLRARNLAN
jgi:hypothetical protein